VPVVILNRDYPGLQADRVVSDNLEGSYQAVRHLLKAGHRRIGIIAGQRDNIVSAQRLQGYERALTERQLKCEEKLIKEGHFSDAHTGYRATMKLLTIKNRPSALFICNVRLTMGALKAIHELGIKIPSELALVSFDDEEWFESVRPRISGVAQPAYDLGSLAANLVVDRIKGNLTRSPCRKVLIPELKVRESSNLQFSVHSNGLPLHEESDTLPSKFGKH
jgi:LacI family transcriptional regulator